MIDIETETPYILLPEYTKNILYQHLLYQINENGIYNNYVSKYISYLQLSEYLAQTNSVETFSEFWRRQH